MDPERRVPSGATPPDGGATEVCQRRLFASPPTVWNPLGLGTSCLVGSDFGVGVDDNSGGDVSYGGAVMSYGNNVDLVCADGLCQ